MLKELRNFSDKKESSNKQLKRAALNSKRFLKFATENGKKYQTTGDYIKVFKAFWHWHQTVNRKHGIEISDITLDLDAHREKPKWVYLTEEQVKRLQRFYSSIIKISDWELIFKK